MFVTCCWWHSIDSSADRTHLYVFPDLCNTLLTAMTYTCVVGDCRASSHNNTFSFAVVHERNEGIFWEGEQTTNGADYLTMLNDYIDNAPANYASETHLQRYHGGPDTGYIDDEGTACAGGECFERLFPEKLAADDPRKVNHYDDMSGASGDPASQHVWVYNATVLQGDKRVAYTHPNYPFVAAYRYHNKINMHHHWDMVHMDLGVATEPGHYIVHFTYLRPYHPPQPPSSPLISSVCAISARSPF